MEVVGHRAIPGHPHPAELPFITINWTKARWSFSLSEDLLPGIPQIDYVGHAHLQALRDIHGMQPS